MNQYLKSKGGVLVLGYFEFETKGALQIACVAETRGPRGGREQGVGI